VKQRAGTITRVAYTAGGGFVLRAAEQAPAVMAFENDAKRIEALMEAMRKLQPTVTKRLEAFMSRANESVALEHHLAEDG
jgi:hypothetical protein